MVAIEGNNCWRKEHAERVAFLIDGAAYFGALASALERAQRSVLIVGWEFHSRVQLRPDDPKAPGLGTFLDQLVSRNRKLHIHILQWDFSLIYLLEREAFSAIQLGWKTHRRVHFEMDNDHPIGASHHQKIVVIDDRVAFVGGMDLTANRWDTRAHEPEDKRRRTPEGKEYHPFHDVQVAMQGPVAAALGDLVRERWKKATSQVLERPKAASDPWPPELRADLESTKVAILRTQAPWDGCPEVLEVERHYADAIRAAKRCIYVENQYLTSARIGKVLAERLAEPDPPEVVVISPLSCDGWLEKTTLGLGRARLLQQLREADQHGRLRVYYPRSGGKEVMVHGKVLIVDDQLVRVGSSNLTNRSMALDTECDVAIEPAEGQRSTREAIVRVRNDLLAEHLGVVPEEVEKRVKETGSLIQTIETLRMGETKKTLLPLDATLDPVVDSMVPHQALLDPEGTIYSDILIGQLIPEPDRRDRFIAWTKAIATLLLPALVVAVWLLTPMRDVLPPGRVWHELVALKQSSLALPAVIAAFVLLSFVPVTALIVAAAVWLDLWSGFFYSVAGVIASATVSYSLGKLLPRKTVQRVAGRHLNELSMRLRNRGITATAVLRLMPVAPFTIVNLVMGFAKTRYRDFIVGTALGMAPGIFITILLVQNLSAAITEPTASNIVIASLLVMAVASGALWIRQRLRKRPKIRGRPNPAAKRPSGPTEPGFRPSLPQRGRA